MNADLVLMTVVLGGAAVWMVWARVSSSRRAQNRVQPTAESGAVDEASEGMEAEAAPGAGTSGDPDAAIRPQGPPPSRGGRRGRPADRGGRQ